MLKKREEALLKDIKNGGEEQGQSQEDEQLVGQLSTVVFEDQFSPEVDRPGHAFKLLIGFQHSSGGGPCNEWVKWDERFDGLWKT